MDRAYAPYSGFHVGCCVRGAAGGLYAGCNVENAAYPQGSCAEPSAIAALIAAGERRIVEVLVIGARSDGAGGYAEDPDLLCTPCGGCRQKLREFAAPDTPVHVCGTDGLRRTFTIGELLPESFGPHNLAGP
jgi:cytidine deaminase